MVFPAIKAPLLRRILMRIFAVLPGFLLWKIKRIFDQISVFWRSNFCIFQIFYFLTSRWFSQQLKLLCSVGFWCVFLQFCQAFLLWKKTYFWSDFCILKVKFLHISDLLFSYKQMVFPAIKAPLLRRILMRIFAVLPGFFAVKKKRIFDQLSVFWRSNFCIFQIFYFLTSRWFSQQLKLLCSVGFWCVFLQFCQAFLLWKKRIFDQISVFWRSNFCIFQIFYFLTSRWFSQQLKLLCSVGFWCVFLQFCQVFLLEKKTYFWSAFCILKVKFLHISDLLFSYKQMVLPAIKAPLLRRILMRIFAVLPGFLLWKKNVFLIRFLYFEGQIFANFRFYFLTSRWFSQQLKLLCSVGFWCVFLQFCQVFCCEKKRIFDQISVFWRSNFCIFQIFYFLTSRWFSQQLKLLCSVGFWCVFLQFCQAFLLWKKNVFLISFLYFEGQIFGYFRSFIFLQVDGFPSN